MKAWAHVYGPTYGKEFIGKIATYVIYSTSDHARAECPHDYRVARVIVQTLKRKK